jgi:thioredoxin 2
MMSPTLHVACPACHAVNRARRDKLTAGPRGRCGKCSALLFDGHPTTLVAASFDSHAVDSDIPLLVDVWAPWCGPCMAMAPQFEQAAERLEPGLRLAKVKCRGGSGIGQSVRDPQHPDPDPVAAWARDRPSVGSLGRDFHRAMGCTIVELAWLASLIDM